MRREPSKVCTDPAQCELLKCVVEHQERHTRFCRRRHGTLVDHPLLLEVYRPYSFLLLTVGEAQLKDGASLWWRGSMKKDEWVGVCVHLFDLFGSFGGGVTVKDSVDFGKDVGCLGDIESDEGTPDA